MLPLVRLFQLASPALPVGAYTYSQGLEWAVESGTVRDEAGAAQWIEDLLHWGVSAFEAPLVAAAMMAWEAGNAVEVQRLNEDFLASRESRELRQEAEQMGHSLVRLLRDLHEFAALPGWRARLMDLETPSFPLAWSAAAAAWQIPREMAVTGYLWAWLENQVMAAVKLVPLGQSAGQRLLARLGADLPTLAQAAVSRPEREWTNFLPGFAMASVSHETQYSRLFRS